MALGVKLPTQLARASMAIALGLAGYIVAIFFVDKPDSYEDFLLIIAYWVGPWLAVVFLDRWFRRGSRNLGVIAQSTKYQNWAGPIAMLVGIVLSVWLFANQVKYTGVIPKHHPAFGDIAFEVGFVISGVVYFVLYKVLKPADPPVVVELPATV
jgi:NCS1 family nucleobase:cation symporter-1